jgi:MFS family permease
MISPAPIIGEVAHALGRELGLVTLTVMGLWTVTVCIGGIIGGAVVDKVGLAKVYIVCAILLTISAFGLQFCGTNLTAVIIVRLIGGAGVGPILTTIARLAAEWFPPEERMLIAGINGLATALGVAVGYAISPIVFMQVHSWTKTMAWMGIFPLFFLIFAVIILLGPKSPEMAIEAEEDPEKAAIDFKLALKEPIIYLCVIYVFMFNWLIQGINDLTPGYLAIPVPVGVGFGPVVAGQMMMVFQITFMIGSLAAAWLNKNVYKGNTRVQVMLAYLLTAVYFFIKFEGVTGSGPNPLLIVVMLITAFFMGQGIATIMGFISVVYPEHITGKLGGMAMGLGLIGGTIGVAFGSTAITKTGNYQLSITIVTIVAIIGCVVATQFRKPKAFEHLREANINS